MKTQRLNRTTLSHLSTFLAVSTVLGLGLQASSANAKSCVAIDEARDNLTVEDRKAAQTLFEEALRDNKLALGGNDCTDRWTVYHIRLGSSLTVIVRSDAGERKEKVSGLSELGGIYSQMVRSIQMGIANTAEGSAVTRDNVAESQTTVNRLPADAIWYVRAGFGATSGGGGHVGPAFGFGRRWELDHVAIDFSFLNTTLYQSESGISGVGMTWGRIGGYYFLDANANSSAYFGGGLGLGTQSVPNGSGSVNHYSGTGLNIDLTAGYEFFRASTIRLFTEANVSLPTYQLSGYDYSPTTGSTQSHIYAPQATLSLGIGWGKPREMQVVRVKQD